MPFAPGDYGFDHLGKWRVESVTPAGYLWVERVDGGYRTCLLPSDLEPCELDEPWQVLAERQARHDAAVVAAEQAVAESCLSVEATESHWAGVWRQMPEHERRLHWSGT
jgi:hypothetical protein